MILKYLVRIMEHGQRESLLWKLFRKVILHCENLKVEKYKTVERYKTLCSLSKRHENLEIERARMSLYYLHLPLS
jgi:hypothetical protein